VNEAEESEDRAGQRVPGRPAELPVDDERGDRAEDQAGEHGPAADQLHAVIDHAGAHELVVAELSGRGAGGGERAIDLGLTPGCDVRDDRQHHRWRMARRRGLERLSADHETDEQQDRQNRDQRDDREQQRGQAEERHQRDHDAGRERIADAAADRLPAGMADIHRRGERAAEGGADHGADAVREQDVAQIVVVTGGRRALDVVHRLGEVVHAERYRGREQRPDVAQANHHVV
jgi:hypothetical protein